MRLQYKFLSFSYIKRWIITMETWCWWCLLSNRLQLWCNLRCKELYRIILRISNLLTLSLWEGSYSDLFPEAVQTLRPQPSRNGWEFSMTRALVNLRSGICPSRTNLSSNKKWWLVGQLSKSLLSWKSHSQPIKEAALPTPCCRDGDALILYSTRSILVELLPLRSSGNPRQIVSKIRRVDLTATRLCLSLSLKILGELSVPKC